MKLFKTKALKAFALITLFSFLTITFSSCYILFPDKGASTEEVDDSDSEKKTDENVESEKTDENTNTETKEEPVEKKKFTVTFNTNGGSAVESQTVEEGSTATKPATDPTKTGLVFVGWYKESTFETSFDFNSAINADTTIYANWASESEIVTITFESNGGSEVAAIKVQKNKTAAAPSSPSRKGYLFKGWYKESTFTNAFSFSTALTENITLYAKWEEKPTTASFTADIETTVSDAERNFVITSEKTDDGYRLTAPAGYDEYEWAVDNTEQYNCFYSENENQITVTAENLPAGVSKDGTYSITVIAYQGNNTERVIAGIASTVLSF